MHDREESMLQRIRNFLQTIFQQLRRARFSFAEQATQQVILERDTDTLHPISIMKKDLDETDTIAVMPVPVRESNTEPYLALMLRKNPAQRYRNLDVMLEQMRRDRLNNTETQFVPGVVSRSARHLQHILEQEEGQ
jgi:hypothetical protein